MTETPAEFVVDASVVVRGLLDEAAEAAQIVDDVARGIFAAHAPDLITAEVANALRNVVATGDWPIARAQERLATFLRLPLVGASSRQLASEALALAVDRGLSGYDALYAALAEALEIPLVTADRRLADAVPGSQLVA